MGLGLERAGGAARLIRPFVVALVIAVVAACTSSTSAPTASPVVVLSPTPIATLPPAPTTATPSPTSTRYVNDVLGLAATLPSPWRVSDCLSGLTREGTYLGQDVLTWRSAAEEHDLGGGADAGTSGALNWVIDIAAEISSQAPTEYASARGGSTGDKVEATSIDGRSAVRVIGGFGTSIYVSNAGRMYTLSLRTNSEPGPRTTDATLTFDSIARSVIFVAPTARPTPTPTPTLSPAVETLVDAVAAAFAASDSDRLRDLMPPKCWFSSAGYPGGSTLISREKMAEILRSAFAQGLKVKVENRPVQTTGAVIKAPFWVWSTWSAYGTAPFTPASTVQLRFDQIDGRWYWIGALFNAPR